MLGFCLEGRVSWFGVATKDMYTHADLEDMIQVNEAGRLGIDDLGKQIQVQTCQYHKPEAIPESSDTYLHACMRART